MFLKVALVGRREGIQRIAVNHDGGRVVSALMRITQFWPYQAWAARRLESGSRAQGEREFGRRQFAHPGLISGIDRTHQRLKSGFPKRRDKVKFCKVEKRQFTPEGDFCAFALIA